MKLQSQTLLGRPQTEDPALSPSGNRTSGTQLLTFNVACTIRLLPFQAHNANMQNKAGMGDRSLLALRICVAPVSRPVISGPATARPAGLLYRVFKQNRAHALFGPSEKFHGAAVRRSFPTVNGGATLEVFCENRRFLAFERANPIKMEKIVVFFRFIGFEFVGVYH